MPELPLTSVTFFVQPVRYVAPGHSARQLKALNSFSRTSSMTVPNDVFILVDDVIVLPCIGPPSTIGHSRAPPASGGQQFSRMR